MLNSEFSNPRALDNTLISLAFPARGDFKERSPLEVLQ